MATDTARVQLELASGRSENTAPFYQTAQRRRSKQIEADATSTATSAVAQTMVEVPLAPVSAPAADREISSEHRGRTPWVAFAVAILSVGFAVWWVMDQRMPDIDPQDVIIRNLNLARAAMADGRYTDPPERSAFHYFSTVLAVDPANADAIAGIDAVADRHLTNARLLLSQGQIAEAGVALEKARRMRPNYAGLAALDTQWRAELRQLLSASTAIARPEPAVIEKPVVAKTRSPVIPKSAPPAKVESAPAPRVADLAPVAAALAIDLPSTSLQAMAEPVPDTGAKLVEERPIVSAAAPVATDLAPVVEPKLIKMVQPEYPQEALMRGIEGWVDVSLQVTASGDVIATRVEESSRGRMFNRAALAAVEQWKYEPRSEGATSDRLRVRLQFKRSN